MQLAYAIKFVADMDKAVAYHRDVLGLTLAFQSSEWSEFATGETRLALHAASPSHPAGSVQLGYRTDDLDALYRDAEQLGIQFSEAPRVQFGAKLARIVDCEGAECSISSR